MSKFESSMVKFWKYAPYDRWYAMQGYYDAVCDVNINAPALNDVLFLMDITWLRRFEGINQYQG